MTSDAIVYDEAWALEVSCEEVVRMAKALREIGMPRPVPRGFNPLDWWQHTASKRGEIARDALGVTAEELLAQAWHEHVEATR